MNKLAGLQKRVSNAYDKVERLSKEYREAIIAWHETIEAESRELKKVYPKAYKDRVAYKAT